MSVHVLVRMSVYVSVYMFVHMYVDTSVYLSVHVSVCLSTCLSIRMSIYLSMLLPTYHIYCITTLLDSLHHFIWLFVQQAMQELQMIFDADAQDAKIAGMRDELANLKHELLLLEMQLVDQLEVITERGS